MYKTRIKDKLWFSQCGRTWLVCRKTSPNPSWTPLCDFKCRPWAKNSSPNTNDLYIHYMEKSTGTPPYLEEKKALPICGNKDGNKINVLKKCISTSVATVLKWMYPYVLVSGVWWWVFGSRSAFKVTQRCSAGIRTCLSADQSSSSTLTESSFLFDPCLIHRDTVMLE